jgi:hypothetical protein
MHPRGFGGGKGGTHSTAFFTPRVGRRRGSAAGLAMRDRDWSAGDCSHERARRAPHSRAQRSLRVFLTVRGFGSLVVAMACYLVLVSTLSLPALERYDDEGRPVPERPRARRQPTERPAASPRPPPRTPPPLEGLADDECERLRRASCALAEEGEAGAGRRRRDGRILLLTSGWGLPRGAPGRPSARREFAMLVRTVEENLANPYVAAVHAFVPPSQCAQEMAETDAVAGEAASTRKRPRRRGRGEAERVLLIVGRDGEGAPMWDTMLRHAAALSTRSPGGGRGASLGVQYVAVVRADVHLPRGLGCISVDAMRTSGAVLTLSCQTHATSCARLLPNGPAILAAAEATAWTGIVTGRRRAATSSTLAGGSVQRASSADQGQSLHRLDALPPSSLAAPSTSTEHPVDPDGRNWSHVYRACRDKSRSPVACVPLIDHCFKYQGVQHALIMPAPPSSAVINALRTLRAEYGNENAAADTLWRVLPADAVLNPCVEVAPVCQRCTELAEAQNAAHLGLGRHLEPQPLPPLLAGPGDCLPPASQRAKRAGVASAAPSNASLGLQIETHLADLVERNQGRNDEHRTDLKHGQPKAKRRSNGDFQNHNSGTRNGTNSKSKQPRRRKLVVGKRKARPASWDVD